jgi:hypothetical protein
VEAEGAEPVARRRLRHPAVGAERVALAAVTAALVVLVILPLASLVWSSVTADGRLTLDHFRRALGGRLYRQALWLFGLE